MPPRSTKDLQNLDHCHIWHPFTHMKQWLAEPPLIIRAAQGMELIDSDGNRYLDGVSSLWCNVHGHRVPEIDQAIIDQLSRISHSTLLGLASESSIELAALLMPLVPKGLTKLFYSDSGATATEIAFKIAAGYWHNLGRGQKNRFVGFTSAYHGDTVGAMSIGRMEAFHRPYFPMLFPVHFAPSPDVYRSKTPDDPDAVCRICLAELRNILKVHGNEIAAVCIEPIVQGAAGMTVHPAGFLSGVRKLCDEFEALLIADEVAVGFGRTGVMFACEHEKVSPDLMCVAKGISGGYLPLAATFATQKIFDAFLGEIAEGKTLFHGHTYTGNALACAAAIASLKLFAKNDVLANVRRKSAELRIMLESLRELPHVGDIRQKSFMVGIELVSDKSTRRPYPSHQRIGVQVCAAIRKHGVILRPLGDVIVLMPPLAMELPDLRRIMEAVRIEIAILK